jgi:hypothetical protein
MTRHGLMRQRKAVGRDEIVFQQREEAEVRQQTLTMVGTEEAARV